MTVSSDDLLMSLLSMDVYNRATNQGVFVAGDGAIGTSVAGATIIAASDLSLDTEHSFHAIAYRLPDNRIVIDYRGTDNTNTNSLDLFAANDIANGWTVGGGYIGDNQSGLAIQFYQDVLNATGHSDLTPFSPAPSNFVFTGHSLGGGLAGMVASLSHGTAIVTDNMPYGIAAIVEYLGEVMRQITLSPTASAFLGVVGTTTEERMASIVAQIPLSNPAALAAAVAAVSAEGHMPMAPDWSKVSAYHVDGEVLQGLREGTYGLDLVGAGAVLAAGGFLTLNPVVVMLGTAVATLGGVYATAFAALNLTMDDTELSVFGWHDTDMVHRHSAALEVLLSYADNKEAENGLFEFWHGKTETVDAVLDGLFNDDIGTMIGLTAQDKNPNGTAPAPNPDYTGFVNPADQMGRMIAYSTITSGNLVFGNTAAEALFNDAIDLGRALEQSNSLTAGAHALGQIIAQYAGQLAYGQITKGGHPGATDGVLSLDSNAELLTVDFSDTLWNLKKEGTNEDNDILGRDSFIAAYVGDIDAYGSNFKDEMTWLWGTSNSNVIDRFAISLKDEGLDVTLPNRAIGSSTTGKASVTLTVASDFADSIRGSSDDDFIIGGDGDDVLYGSLGNDLLVGGNGNDTFVSLGEHTVFVGGGGDDTATYMLGGAVDADLSDEGIIVTRRGTSGEDRLFGVETVALSGNADNFTVSTDSYLNLASLIGPSLLIDGGGETNGDGDAIDFSGLGTGVVFQNGGKVRFTIPILDETFIAVELPTAMKFTNFETIYGTNQADVYQDGTSINKTVYLGGGADIIKRAGGGTTIDVGANDGAVDTINVSGDVQILNVGKEDKISLGGLLTLHGGLRNRASESLYATSLGGLLKYGLTTTGDLLISFAGLSVPGVSTVAGQTMTLAGWGSTYNGYGIPYLGAAGITLAEFKISAVRIMDDWTGKGTLMGTWELFGLMTKTATGHNFWGGLDPLVLDLNGDGFNLGTLSSAAPMFDTDADGYSEHSGWVGREDGFLVRDLGHDGKIADSREMFGGQTQDGFAALAELDANGDGIVNAADNGLVDFNGDGTIDSSDTFSELKIWQDLNQNGRTDAGELKSLSDFDIDGLSVTPIVSTQNINGNLVTATSAFIRGDGSSGAIGNVILNIDNQNTTYSGPTITVLTAAKGQPDLKGYGTLVSLHEALSMEPGEISTVSQAMANFSLGDHDLATLRDDIRPIIAVWAKGSPIRDAAGVIIHGDAAVAHYEDMPVIRMDGDVVDYAYDIQAGTQTVGGVQAATKTYKFVSGLTITVATPDGVSEAGLTELFAEMGAPNFAWTSQVVNGVTQYTSTYTYSNGEVVTLLSTSNPTGNAVTSASKSLNALLYGTYEDSYHRVYTQESVLGSDMAFFERYLGEALPFHELPSNIGAALTLVQNAISNMEGNLNLIAARVAVQSEAFSSVFSDLTYDVASDTFKSKTSQQLAPTFANLLTLAGAEASPLTWLKTWDDLLGTIIADYDRGNGGLNTNGFLAQNLIAAFEVVHPSFSLATAAEGIGLDPTLFVTGAGVMTGTTEADILYLDGTNQTASGGEGLDNYIVGARFGQDIINDIEAPMGNQQEDVVRFTTLNASDLTFTRDGINLIITANATGDSITINGQFYGEWAGPLGSGYWEDKGVSTLVFADGTVWDQIDMARAASHPDSASTTLVGTADNDFLDGGAGDDRLEGGGDGDIYVFGRGYGHDVINDLEDNMFRSGIDILTFRSGISIDDLTFRRVGNTDTLSILVDGGEEIDIEGQFAATYTGVFGTTYSNQIEVLTFEDGGMLYADDICNLILTTSKTSGNDTIYGFSREDVMDGGAGDDFLSGGNESDTYIFGRGYGHDTISEGQDNILSGNNDVVEFNSDVAPSDIRYSREGDDLIITIAGTNDSLRVVGQYSIIETGPFGARGMNMIEQFKFADGTVKGWREIMDLVIASASTPGNDHIVGTHFDDNISGGAGDDLLEGAAGSDTYHFGLGDGHDTIRDDLENILASNEDTLAFGPGITLADINVNRPEGTDDVLITVGDGGDSVLIKGQFSYFTINVQQFEIEHFTFADGTSLTQDGLRTLYFTQHQTAGNDTLDGFYTNDTITGGAGNDLLRGGDGADTYVFEQGFGQDIIHESVGYVTYSDDDKIVFGEGLNPEDVILQRVNQDLIIKFSGTTDQITVQSQFSRVAYFDGWNDIETIQFADGTVWTQKDIRTKILDQMQTSGNDDIQGFWNSDQFDGGAGNDTFHGNGGGDTYHFGRGDGSDTIIATVGSVYDDQADTLEFKAGVDIDDVTFTRSGNDLVVSIDGTTDSVRIKNQFTDQYSYVEYFRFADGTVYDRTDWMAVMNGTAATSGNDRLLGTGGADTIQGLAGTDALVGYGGSDTYVYNRGDGADTIYEIGHAGDMDTLSLGTGIAVSDISILRSSLSGATIAIAGQTEVITLDSQFKPDGFGIESIKFSDGTVWTLADIRNAYLSRALAIGADTTWGFDGVDDTIQGGVGSDTLMGSSGSDTYIENANDGFDTIKESAGVSGTDKLLLGTGLNVADLTFARAGTKDLVLSFTNKGVSITLADQFNTAEGAGIETVQFGDGTVWTKTQLFDYYVHSQGNASDQTITGTSDRDDYLYGGAGNDTLNGGGGNDTYYYDLGDGQDIINEDGYGTADVLKFGAGISASNLRIARSDVYGAVLTFAGQAGSVKLNGQFDGNGSVETIQFADGTSWSKADLRAAYMLQVQTAGNDEIWIFNGTDNVVQGGTGNDILHASEGNDTFIYNVGDGDDRIYSSTGTNRDVDTLSFGAGISAANLVITRTSLFGAVISFAGIAGSINLQGQFDGDSAIHVFKFSDGTAWSLADIRAHYLAQTETDGNDLVRGFQYVDDTLRGGLGDDTYVSSSGDDTYEYSRGDGNDTIAEAAFDGEADALHLLDIASDEVLVTRNGASVTLLIDGAGEGNAGSVYLQNATGGSDAGVESIVFADGTIWSQADLLAHVAYIGGTNGNDTVTGTDLADLVMAGKGDDILKGGNGGDTYVYYSGDGNDSVQEVTAGTSFDTLKFADLTLNDIAFERNSNDKNSLVIRVLATNQTISLKDQFNQYGGVEKIEFANGNSVGGTNWVLDSWLADRAVIQGTTGNDTITGTVTKEVFRGGLGNDHILGGEGSDTYLYARGDGNDNIDDLGVTATDKDLLKFTDLNEGDVTIARSGSNILLTVTSTGQVVTLTGQFSLTNENIGVEAVEFADGITWSRATILDKIMIKGTAGNDTVTGTSSDDAISGGLGDDTLNGGSGVDTYYFNKGDGNDTVFEDVSWNYLNDKIVINGYSSSQATFTRLFDSNGAITNNLKINFASQPGDSISMGTINGTDGTGVELVKFSDRTLTQADLRTETITRSQTSGNDTIYGFSFSETFNGGLGNDTISGGRGSDTYLYAAGDGADKIIENGNGDSATDTLVISGYTSADAIFSRMTDGNGALTNSVKLTFQGVATDSVDLGLIVQSNGDGNGMEAIQFQDKTYTRQSIQTLLVAQSQTAGNDTIVGFNSDETFDCGLGNDTINGGSGNDLYVYEAGDGADTIVEGSFAGTNDRLTISGYALAQTSFTRLRDANGAVTGNILITFPSNGNDSINIGSVTAGGEVGLEGITVSGVAMTRADVLAAAWIRGTTGAEIIGGTTDADRIDGGAGNDTLNGGSGDDVLVGGSGNDIIQGGAGYDQVNFTGSLSDYTFTRQIDGSILATAINGTDGVDTLFDVESVWFAATNTAKSLNSLLPAGGTTGTSGDDDLLGTPGADTLNGFQGNDTMTGGRGSDTYIFAAGDGNDQIVEAAISLEAGLISGEAIYSPDRKYRLTIQTDGNFVLYHGTYAVWASGTSASGVSQAKFLPNGNLAVYNAAGTQLWQSNTAGNDGATLGLTNDGNLVIRSASGAILWATNSISDNSRSVTPFAQAGDLDTLSLTDYVPADISITRVLDGSGQATRNAIITFANSSDSINIGDVSDANSGGIEILQFGDGTVWNRSQIVAAVRTAGTTGNDTLTATDLADTVLAGTGNDTLAGGRAGDTYIFNAGDGADKIIEFGVSVETGLKQGQSIFSTDRKYQLTLQVDGNLVLYHGTSALWSSGTNGQKAARATLDANGNLVVYNGLDVVLWRSGSLVNPGATFTLTDDGNLAIKNTTGVTVWSSNTVQDSARSVTAIQTTFEADTLAVNGYTSAQALFTRVLDANGKATNEVLLSFVGSTDSINIGDIVSADGAGVESIQFADNVTLTRSQVLAATQIIGTASADQITGTVTGEKVTGGAGDDVLAGGKGSDIYDFSAGDGHDQINEAGRSLSEGITIGQSFYSPDRKYKLTLGTDSNLVLSHAGYSLWDAVTTNTRANLVKFTADGNLVIYKADGSIVWQSNTAGNAGATISLDNDGNLAIRSSAGAILWATKTVQDSTRAVTAAAADGDTDTLVVQGYASTAAVFTRILDGAGVATNRVLLSFKGGTDTIDIGDVTSGNGEGLESIQFADNVTLTRAQIVAATQVVGSVAADQITGTAGADRIVAGTGNDTLSGGKGSDTYVFSAGDGSDVIFENSASLEAGIKIGESAYSADGKYRVTLASDGSLQIWHGATYLWATSSANLRINEARFTSDGNLVLYKADGTIGWQSNTGGSTGNTIRLGNNGNLTIRNSYGSTVWASNTTSDGGRAVTPLVFAGDTDTLELKDYLASDIVFNRVSGPNGEITGEISVSFNTGSDSINIGKVEGANGAGIDSIKFADGTVWTHAQIVTAIQTTLPPLPVDLYADAFIGTAGNDTMTGTNWNDVFFGRAGNDRFNSGAGSDTYIYGLGDGTDYIDDESSSTSDVDTLKFNDLNPGDVTFSRVGVNGVFTVNSTGDTVTIDEQFYSTTANWGMEKVQFADGTVWNLANIWSNGWIRGTNADDTLAGSNANDTFLGGLGNDRFNSGAGSDTYIYRLGDGTDYIDDESGSTADVDVLKLTDLNPTDLTYVKSGVHAILTVINNGSTITLDDQFYSTTANWGIEKIQFANGTEWNRAQILAAAQGTLPPVVLDLDGDGVSLVSQDISNVMFDMNSDGVKDRTGWVSAVDGILALDRNGDGVISSGSELSFIGDVKGATSDLAGLAAYDSNHSGKLDAGDTGWGAFQVWQDANQDGISQAGELKGLNDIGITSIGLDRNTTAATAQPGGNVVLATSTVEHSDGSVSEAGDVVLAYTPAPKRSIRPTMPTKSPLSQVMRIRSLADLERIADGGNEKPGLSAEMEKTRLKLVNAMAGFSPSFSAHNEQWHSVQRPIDTLSYAPSPDIHYAR